MIARLLRWVLAFELIAASLLGWLFTFELTTPFGPIVSLVFGLLLVLAVHSAFVALYFLVTRSVGGAVPSEFRLGILGALRTYIHELFASLRGFNFAHPFLAHAEAPLPSALPRPIPLLFVHGYFCNRAIWLPLMREAAHRGFICEAVTLEPAFGSIEDYPQVIEAAVKTLLVKAHCDQVILVCHSMGGLAAREWMRRFGDAHVTRIITLGSPHAGTVMARCGHSVNVRQMRLKSPWLAALSASESAERRGKITSIFSFHDNIIAPQGSSVLTGAKAIGLGGIGHVTLVYSKQVWDIVFGEIERVCNAAGAEREISLDTAF